MNSLERGLEALRKKRGTFDLRGWGTPPQKDRKKWEIFTPRDCGHMGAGNTPEQAVADALGYPVPAEPTPLEKLDAIRRKLTRPNGTHRWIDLRGWSVAGCNNWDVYNENGDSMTYGSGTSPEEAIDKAYEKVCKPKGDEMGKKKLSDTEKLTKLGERLGGNIEIRCDGEDDYQLAHAGDCITGGDSYETLSEAIDAAYKKLCGKKIKSEYGTWRWSPIRECWQGSRSLGCVRRKEGGYTFSSTKDCAKGECEYIYPEEAATLPELTDANPDLLPPTE
jgi:hypothetical protein